LIINNSEWIEALTEYKDYICTETLAISLELASEVPDGVTVEINDIPCTIRITKVS